MLFAEENETVDDTSTIDFFEFLGNWEIDDGEWIDPNEIAAEEDMEITFEPQQDTSRETVQ